jgi:hypothetical protein
MMIASLAESVIARRTSADISSFRWLLFIVVVGAHMTDNRYASCCRILSIVAYFDVVATRYLDLSRYAVWSA